jgi:single-stranded DNA-binding protein
MSVFALVSGRLHGEPRTFPTKTGGRLTAFKLKVLNGSALEYWEVVTFSDSAREELEKLSEGASLSAVGALHVETYEWNGETRLKLKLTADSILALKPKAREAKKAEKPPPAAAARASQGTPWAAPGAPTSSTSGRKPWDHGGLTVDDDIPF